VEDASDMEDEDGDSATNVSDIDIGRTDDPVRIYLRERGSVGLLSREGEIAIATRIEAGRDMMIGGICESQMTIQAMLEWHRALEKEDILLREIIDLEATYGAENETETTDTDSDGKKDGEGKGKSKAKGKGKSKDADDAEPGETAGEEEDGEDDESNMSLSAMEEELRPQVIAN